MIKKLLTGVSMAALLFGASACGESDGSNSGSGGSESSGAASTSPSANAAPKPDVADVPDVVAEVNGEEIPKDEFVATYEGQFQQMAMQAQQTGQPVDQDKLKQQTAKSMIDNEILVQEAGNRGIEATDKQIDQTLQRLVKQNGMKSTDQLFAALKKQGMNKEDVMPQIEHQVVVEQLIADEAGNIQPTEQELRKLYEQTKAQQGGSGSKIPPFEKVKPQLKQQAVSQKESQVARNLVSDLREKADIKNHL
ncbi:peptidyl-prolyl cis-trans isomerase SurA [Haloactinopolyspora alba]|uniref:peptidylprolyl isomerase n=2 Tax=Haloactinopolyspora alba TaxID=648780 RepID=A0A2P8E6V1_9ACTN|nr:peptidyl-prolyl cis-trans isomerase SurA [Haloactinopolyspora alba]